MVHLFENDGTPDGTPFEDIGTPNGTPFFRRGTVLKQKRIPIFFTEKRKAFHWFNYLNH